MKASTRLLATTAVIASMIIIFTMIGQLNLAVYAIWAAIGILTMSATLMSLSAKSVTITNAASAILLGAFLIYLIFRLADIIK